MFQTREQRRALIRSAVSYLALTVVGGLVAYWTLFTRFAEYDDEGYLLASLRSFVAGAELYTDIYSQYGPFYYEVFGAFFELTGRTVGMDGGRLLVVLIWLLTSFLVGVASHRLTGSLRWGVAGCVVGFALLAALANEPMHPVGLVVLLEALIGAALAVVVPARPFAGLAMVGLTGAALALTKVNVGGFALIAAAFACVLVVDDLRRRRWLTFPVTAAVLGLPLVLFSADLNDARIQRYALVVMAGLLALILVTARPARGALRGGHLLAALVSGAAASTTVIVVVVLALGSPLSDVLHVLFVQPLGQRDTFSLPLDLHDSIVVWAFLAVGAAGLVRRRLALPDAAAPLTALVRIGVGFAMVCSIAGVSGFPIFVEAGPLGTPVIFAWLVVVPPREVPDGTYLARVLLAAVAVLQALQAYPVAGTQVRASAVLLAVVAVVVVADGIEALGRWMFSDPRLAPLRQPMSAAVAAAVIGSVAFGAYLQRGIASYDSYSKRRPLPFQTANRLRLEPGLVAAYTSLVDVLRLNCRRFVTEPGLNSFHEWSGILPATGLNPNHWMKLLDAAQQQRVVDAVSDEPGLCLLRNSGVLRFWMQDEQVPDRPLKRFIDATFTGRPIYSAAGYDIFRRPDRPSGPK